MLKAFYDDIAAVVTGKGQLTCPGQEGLNAVELANAIMLSSIREKAVSLPLDRKDYSEFITAALDSEAKTA